MSEKEKMLHHELYDPGDAQLSQELHQAKIKCHEINQISPADEKELTDKFHELLPSFHPSCHIETPFFCDYGTHIQMGEDVYMNHHTYILDGGGVTIGNHVFIGPNVCLTTAAHPENRLLREQHLEYAYPIVIEDHVWIGANVVINPGVTIKEGTIIGSGSVVTHDIEAYVVAAGVPCRRLRKVQEDEK